MSGSKSGRANKLRPLSRLRDLFGLVLVCGLQALFQTHLQETEVQVERLNETLQVLGAPLGKPCNGMAGLVEEGAEVMSESNEKDDSLANLA
jgi:ferritin-like metal-binding protein YciE